jgi:hypothetical protein
MFISLAVNKEETQELQEIPVIVCSDILFNEYGTGCVEHINDWYP